MTSTYSTAALVAVSVSGGVFALYEIVSAWAAVEQKYYRFKNLEERNQLRQSLNLVLSCPPLDLDASTIRKLYTRLVLKSFANDQLNTVKVYSGESQPALEGVAGGLKDEVSIHEYVPLPKITIEAPLSINDEHLARYIKAIQEPLDASTSAIDDDAILPPFYFAALTGPLQLFIASHPSFPVKAIGAVNSRSRIVRSKAITVREARGAKLAARGWVNERGRRVKRGLEYDIITQVSADDTIIWEYTFTVQSASKNVATGKSAPRPVKEKKTEEESTPLTVPYSLPFSAGPRYAQLSGDTNPIHTFSSKLLIKAMFGLSSRIAHGMYVVGIAGAASDSPSSPFNLHTNPFVMSVAFIRPTLLPAKGTIAIEDNAITISTDKATIKADIERIES